MIGIFRKSGALRWMRLLELLEGSGKALDGDRKRIRAWLGNGKGWL